MSSVTEDSLHADVLRTVGTISPTIDVSPAPSPAYPVLLTYLDLLLTWGARMDLISQRDAVEAARAHLVDCVVGGAIFQALSHRVGVESAAGVLDVGSGAGLPGVVWAILFPQRQIILCEPREKRVQFLKEVRRKLKLENARIVASRVDALSDSVQAGDFEVVTSRALGMEERLVGEIKRSFGDESCPPRHYAWMVGENWAAPKGVSSLYDTSYTVPGLIRHRLVIARECFT